MWLGGLLCPFCARLRMHRRRDVLPCPEIPSRRRAAPPMTRSTAMAQPPAVRFGVIGINHAHIHGQVDLLLRAGAELVAFYAREPELAAPFAQRYPQARQVHDQRAILEDATLQLVATAAIP